MRKEAGFTLIELLSAMALAAILMTLGASGLRQYWLVRSLDAAGGEVSSELRLLQQRAASESSPVLFGASFRPGTTSWKTFRYSMGANISDAADDTCVALTNGTLSTGVTVLATTAFAASSQVSSGKLSAGCGVLSTDKVTVFFPKGSATSGHLDLQQPSLGRSTAVCVSPLTSRVFKATIEEAASC